MGKFEWFCTSFHFSKHSEIVRTPTNLEKVNSDYRAYFSANQSFRSQNRRNSELDLATKIIVFVSHNLQNNQGSVFCRNVEIIHPPLLNLNCVLLLPPQIVFCQNFQMSLLINIATKYITLRQSHSDKEEILFFSFTHRGYRLHEK